MKKYKTMKTLYNILSGSGRRIVATATLLVTMMLCSTQAIAAFNMDQDIWICNNGNWDLSNVYLHLEGNGWAAPDIQFTSKGYGLYQAVGSGNYNNLYAFSIVVGGTSQGRVWEGKDASHCCFYTNDSGWGVVPNQYGIMETHEGTYVWNVNFSYNGTNWSQNGNRNASYSGDKDFGIVTTDVKLTQYWAWCYGDSHDLKLFRKIKYNNNSWPDDFTEEYSQHWNDSGDKQITSQGEKVIFKYENLYPGIYQYQYYLRVDGNGFTQDAYKYATNNGSNMKISFTVPGFLNLSASSHGFGTVNQGGMSSEFEFTYNHYGTPLNSSNCSITTSSGSSGSVVDYFTVTSIGESSVKVAFTPKSSTSVGSKTAYLHITDAQSKSLSVITLTGTVAEGAQITAGDEPVLNLGPLVTLSGYIKQAGCNGSVTQDYRPYGFYYIKKSGNECADVASGALIEVDNGPKTTGDVFSATITGGLENNTEYYYKPYVKNPDNNVVTASDNCYEFRTLGPCNYPTGDTIYYTIDASKTKDPCNLVFPTIDAALEELRTHNDNSAEDFWWDNVHSMLKRNIVFEIVPSADGYGVKDNRVDFSNINKFNAATGSVPTKRFIIRPKEAGTKPVIWGMDLANSRWVTVKSVDIRRTAPSTSDGIGHSCILIGLNDASNTIAVGYMENSGLEFKDCIIEGKNFCCIHANGVNGLYMENCNLVAEGDDNTTEDTFNWGASMKFMNSKNITLLRNNFKGAHANNIFAQNTQNMLIMENVFWNDNAVTRGSNSSWNYKAIIRLIKFGISDADHNVKNIGMYYNTMYLANNPGHADNFDFLTFGGLFGDQTQTSGDYDWNTIDFKYNNCYSYDTAVPGKSTSPFCGNDISGSTHITNNNFWSKYDKEVLHPDPKTAISVFSFGNNIKTPYVSLDPGDGMVCETAPNTPEGIIIKGNGMNEGPRISSDISGLGAEKITSDRNYVERPEGDTWTYGAYQTSTGSDVDKIIWHATTEFSEGVYHWDNRNNWYRETADGRLVLVNCTDRLSENLEVIIPDKNDPKYGKIPGYPTIIPWDSDLRKGEATSIYGKYGAEAVFAGADGVIGTADKTHYVKNLTINYGGALLGVENLNNGTKRYTNVKTNLSVPRKEWILVGSVVSNAISGDFYKYHKPHVYMQQFTVDNSGNVAWNTPFTDLKTKINPQSSFAIFAADQYGEYKLPAKTYYTREENNPERAANAADEPVTITQTGDFAYDHPDATNGDGYATIELKEGYNILNNAYPAVMDATALNTALNTLCGGGNFSIKLFDYTDGDWRSYSLVSAENRFILPQSGFLIQNTSGLTKYLKLEPSLFAGNRSTMLRNASAEAGVIVKAINTATSKGSVIGVFYNVFNEDKTFNASSTENAELYVIGDNSKKLSVFGISDMQAVVPLGVRNKAESAISVKFNIERAIDMQSVILEDRSVDPVAKYDLLNGDMPVFRNIPSGDTNGRFFLNINYAEESSDPEVPTAIIDHDSESAACGIEIYTVGNLLHVVAQDIDIIKSITITDLAGRTFSVKPSDAVHSISNVNALSGTYIVTAITERCAVQQKVLIK